jgi:hypothetical protein
MSFIAHFENLEDSRTDINKHYDLLDMVFLTMSAVLSGAKGWKAIHPKFRSILGIYSLIIYT